MQKSFCADNLVICSLRLNVTVLAKLFFFFDEHLQEYCSKQCPNASPVVIYSLTQRSWGGGDIRFTVYVCPRIPVSLCLCVHLAVCPGFVWTISSELINLS